MRARTPRLCRSTVVGENASLLLVIVIIRQLERTILAAGRSTTQELDVVQQARSDIDVPRLEFQRPVRFMCNETGSTSSMHGAGKETSRLNSRHNTSSSFRIRIPFRFAVFCFASTALLSFGLGRASRHVLLRLLARAHPAASGRAPSLSRQMPRLLLPKGKVMPNAAYTSKHFDTALTTCDSVLLAKGPTLTSGEADASSCPNPEAGSSHLPEEASNSLHEDYQPVGQHLLVDIKKVDASFLNSQERLAEAMITMVEESGTTMLSYHCHKLEPDGVSCVGVLLESHITFHTWPEAGVITLDMFTCGTVQMLPLVGMITRVCGIPENPIVERPQVQWAFKNRGFPARGHKQSSGGADLDRHVLGSTDVLVKQKVADLQTEVQRIQIYDVSNPRSPSPHQSHLQPDRIMYTDNVMQSRRYGEKEYHEALVHPAMLAHERPRRVAILGGGDGAALREVLKHRSVQRVTMIEIDRGVVDLSRRFLPQWSTCDAVVGGAASCFDDPRSNLVYADAVAWFKDKFGEGAVASDADRFDVIVMDALDQSSNILFRDEDFISAVSNALLAGGVLVAQVGKAGRMNDAPREFAQRSVIDVGLVSDLQSHRFVKVTEYNEGHGGLLGPWTFMAAFKDESANERWFATEAEVEIAVRDRLLPRVSGSGPPLHYFDGSVMRSYAFPNRVAEEYFCRREPPPSLCRSGHGFDPELPSAPSASLRVSTQDSSQGEGIGYVFNESFPENTYIAIDATVNDMHILPRAERLIRAAKAGVQGSSTWDAFYSGDAAAFPVDSGIAPIRVRCNGTGVSEVMANSDGSTVPSAAYDPFVDRNLVLLSTAITERSVQAGESVAGESVVTSIRPANGTVWRAPSLLSACPKTVNVPPF